MPDHSGDNARPFFTGADVLTNSLPLSADRLRAILGDRLAAAAQQLIEAGSVSKVRVLRDG